MKVKTVTRFRDLEANKIREPEEVFDINEKRGNYLKTLGFVEEIKEKPKQAAE